MPKRLPIVLGLACSVMLLVPVQVQAQSWSPVTPQQAQRSAVETPKKRSPKALQKRVSKRVKKRLTKPKAMPRRMPANRSATLGFDVTLHGFRFANWADLGIIDDVDLETLRRLFDDASICESVVDGKCQALPTIDAFVTRLNSKLSEGRCEGLALAAYHYFRNGRSGIDNLVVPEVVADINYWSSTQILTAAQAAAKTTREWSLRMIAEQILKDIESGGGATLGIYDVTRAHALLPIAIQIDAHTATITVYETNTPQLQQVIRLNFASDVWVYEVQDHNGLVIDNWSGTKNLSIVGLNTRSAVSTNYFKR